MTFHQAVEKLLEPSPTDLDDKLTAKVKRFILKPKMPQSYMKFILTKTKSDLKIIFFSKNLILKLCLMLFYDIFNKTF